MSMNRKMRNRIALLAAVLAVGCACIAPVSAFAEESAILSVPAASASEPISIVIGSAEGVAGSEATVPVTWQSAVPFSGATIQVNYDPSVLGYKGCTIPDGSDLKKNVHFEVNETGSGVVYVTYTLEDGATLTNANVELTFELKAEGTSAVTLDMKESSILDANDEAIEIHAQDGSVSVAAVTTVATEITTTAESSTEASQTTAQDPTDDSAATTTESSAEASQNTTQDPTVDSAATTTESSAKVTQTTAQDPTNPTNGSTSTTTTSSQNGGAATTTTTGGTAGSGTTTTTSATTTAATTAQAGNSSNSPTSDATPVVPIAAVMGGAAAMAAFTLRKRS